MRHFLKLHLYGVPSYMIPQKHHLILQIVVYLFEFRLIFGTRKIIIVFFLYSWWIFFWLRWSMKILLEDTCSRLSLVELRLLYFGYCGYCNNSANRSLVLLDHFWYFIKIMCKPTYETTVWISYITKAEQ